MKSMKKSLVLSLLSGVLLFLSFPKFNLAFLVWFALVPLLIALKDKSLKESFAFGLLTGFIFFLGILYWISIFSIAGLVILCLYLGLYIAIFAWGLSFVKQRSNLSEIMVVPLLWTGLEFLRSLGLLGFPWGSLAYAQYKSLPLIQIVRFTGVYGVSFLIVLVNATVASLFTSRQRILRKVFPVILILFFSISYGYLVISQKLAKESLKIGIVQGNIPQEKKWDPDFRNTIINIYRQSTHKLSGKNPALIIWPETAIPGYFKHNKKIREEILNIAQETKSHLIVGSPDFGSTNKYYNSAFFISPAGKIINEYRKIHLVPFGEFVPFKRIFPFIKKVVRGVSDFSFGNEYTVFPLPQAKFSVIICFEDIFPDLVRNFVKSGAEFIVNITNDAWYKRTSAPYQHANMTIFRAVENNVSIVRVANTGISSFINPYGKIEKSTDIFASKSLVQKVVLPRKKTFYTKYGDIFSWFCVGLSVLFMVKALIKRS